MIWTNITKHEDVDGNVTKFVFTKDDAVAEAVLYRYPDYETRTVICCSTQSGCPIGCRFCGAGDSFVRSLTTDEILTQIYHCIEATGIDHYEMDKLQIMFMSMGEPLLNLKYLVPALRSLYYAMPRASLLISTSAPKVVMSSLYEISMEIPTVGLQFSIHESTDVERNKLIPFKNKLSLEEIAYAGETWHFVTGRKPFFNYCAHESNSSELNAYQLMDLFDPEIFEATVTVICERNDGLPASNDHQKKLATDFASKLLDRGYNVRVFDPAGQDTIGGGCGQLHFVQRWFTENSDKVKSTIGTNLPSVHAPSNLKQ